MKNVHTEHCQVDDCKYGNLDCPVYIGLQKPSYPEDEYHVDVGEEEFQARRNAVDDLYDYTLYTDDRITIRTIEELEEEYQIY